MDAQMKRGILEVCVLTVLRKKDSYGYQIIKDMADCVQVSESTLYPILKRLEAGNCLNVYSVEHNGRLRKFYRLTAAGQQRIPEFLEDWKSVMNMYQFIEEGWQNDKA